MQKSEPIFTPAADNINLQKRNFAYNVRATLYNINVFWCLPKMKDIYEIIGNRPAFLTYLSLKFISIVLQ